MWENEHKKIVIRNCVIAVLLVIFSAVLCAAILMVNRQIRAEDEALKSANQSQQQEQSDARQENLEAIQKEYEKDLQTLEQFLPGIVCWGDSLTAGSAGNISYPYILQRYINTYLCDVYDFRGSIENADEYARLNWDDYKMSIPVVNLGSGQEDTATILGRSGVQPYVVAKDFHIPADTAPVEINIASVSGKSVAPLKSGNAGVNPVTINGVEGTLSLNLGVAAGSPSTYTFARSSAGDEISVSEGSTISTAVSGEYKDYIHIVWLGTYGGFRTPEELVNDTKLLLQRQSLNSERYIVMGPCTYDGSWYSGNAYTLNAIDTAMLQAFGSHYINVRKYLCEDGLKDAGISPTKTDTSDRNQGYVPTSFRSANSSAELNGAAYALIGKLVYERMDRLGFFDEVRKELNIDRTVRDILAKDSHYFENQLKNH